MKKLICIMLAGVLCFSMMTSALAASPYLEYGSCNRDIKIKSISSLSTTWQSIVNSSMAAWNAANANVTIREASVSLLCSNSVEVNEYDDTWYGLCSQTYSANGCTTKFTIRMNSRTISKDATNFSNFAQSTLVHEFGHVFWLCDEPDTSYASIMKYSRNRNTMIVPQQYDINNVRAMYP